MDGRMDVMRTMAALLARITRYLISRGVLWTPSEYAPINLVAVKKRLRLKSSRD
jgi:hypothetical protein